MSQQQEPVGPGTATWAQEDQVTGGGGEAAQDVSHMVTIVMKSYHGPYFLDLTAQNDHLYSNPTDSIPKHKSFAYMIQHYIILNNGIH